MARGKTLWEMLLEWLAGPQEFKYYNPLRARVGSPVTLDTVELRDLNFFLREVRAYRRQIEGREFPFADYVLVARQLDGDEVVCRVRLVPAAGGAGRGEDHDVLLLRLYDDRSYDEGLHNVVRDTTGKFEVLEDGHVTEEYWRVNDVLEPYKAEVAVLRDVNEDKTVQADEVERLRLEYWDYWRETPDEAGTPSVQYLFVEMDADNGWFQLWRGQAIDPRRVTVF